MQWTTFLPLVYIRTRLNLNISFAYSVQNVLKNFLIFNRVIGNRTLQCTIQEILKANPRKYRVSIDRLRAKLNIIFIYRERHLVNIFDDDIKASVFLRNHSGDHFLEPERKQLCTFKFYAIKRSDKADVSAVKINTYMRKRSRDI